MRNVVVCIFGIAFALVLTRANAFSQRPSALDDTRFDSLGRVAIERFVEAKFFWKYRYDLLVPRSDSALFSQFALHRPDKHVYVGSDTSIVPRNADDSEREVHVFTSIRRRIEYERGGKDTTFVRALFALQGYTPGYVTTPFLSSIEVFRDTIVPSAQPIISDGNQTRSLWQSIKPVLITIGAATIVALFFLIRS